jgi:hypothetical protein
VDLCGLEDADLTLDGCSFDTTDAEQTCTGANVKQIVVPQSSGCMTLGKIMP